MTSYTPAQLAGILKSAGWPEQYIPLGVSIIEAESGGNSQSNLHTSRENSWGLFQINLMAHPEVSQECATDPICSAKYAWGLTRGGTYFGDWTTFTEGRYLSFLHSLFPGWSYQAGTGGVTVTAGQAFQALGDWASTVAGPSASTGGIAQPSAGGDLRSAVLSGLGLPAVAPSDLIKGTAYFLAASMGFSLVIIGAYGIVTGKSSAREAYVGFAKAGFGTAGKLAGGAAGAAVAGPAGAAAGLRGGGRAAHREGQRAREAAAAEARRRAREAARAAKPRAAGKPRAAKPRPVEAAA